MDAPDTRDSSALAALLAPRRRRRLHESPVHLTIFVAACMVGGIGLGFAFRSHSGALPFFASAGMMLGLSAHWIGQVSRDRYMLAWRTRVRDRLSGLPMCTLRTLRRSPALSLRQRLWVTQYMNEVAPGWSRG